MDRVTLGLEKAYRGWGIPGHLYSRQGEILAAGQEEQFALPGGMLEEMFSRMDQWDGPSVYSEPSGICFLLFFCGENLAALGPVAVRRITEMEEKNISLSGFEQRENCRYLMCHIAGRSAVCPPSAFWRQGFIAMRGSFCNYRTRRRMRYGRRLSITFSITRRKRSVTPTAMN